MRTRILATVLLATLLLGGVATIVLATTSAR
jgi:hypothetical protein